MIGIQSLRRIRARLEDYFWPGPWYPNLFWMMQSMWLSRCIYVVARLGIADLLKEKPRTCAELAEMTQCDEASLHKILRALAAFHVFSEDKQGVIHLTRRTKKLLSNADDSLRYWAIKMGEEGWSATKAMLEAVKTGQSGFRLAHGKSSWEYYRDNPLARSNFIRAMDLFTQHQVAELVTVGDFGRFRQVVDVGGGRGALVVEILRKHPNLRGIVFDTEETISQSREFICAAGLEERCRAVAGNFLEAVPAGADLYISKHSLRDWSDTGALQILQAIRAAMPDQATLMVIDAVIRPADGVDRLVKLLDVELFIEEGGGLRTLDDFKALFQKSGFELLSVRGTSIRDAKIIEAKPV